MDKKEKRLYFCFAVMAILYIVDSVISYYLPFNFTKNGFSFVPSISLLMFILLSITLKDKPTRFFFAAICGFYYCMVYANSVVIYVIFYLLIVFLRSYVFRNENISLYEFFVFSIFVLIGKEIIVYWLMRITSTTYLSLFLFIIKRLIPTLIGNLIFIPGIYYLFKKFNLKIEIDPYEEL